MKRWNRPSARATDPRHDPRSALRKSLALAALTLAAGPFVATGAPGSAAARLDVRFDAAEADQALAIVETAATGEAVAPARWPDLFSTDGYRRLKQREAAMHRDFTDEEFREFLLAPKLVGRAPALRETLARWRSADVTSAAARALAYLPEEATIRATIYPMVKPKPNSFVFDLESDPAIFLFLDPEVSDAKFANTVAHELHHIGFGTACPGPAVGAELEALDPNLERALRWQGAFGEGFAMLAAAGGVDVHPHAASPPAERERWDRDVARYAEDVATLDAFFLALIDGSLSEDEELERARSFYGIQGPWYTVGWRIAEAIERELGREALIEAFCDPRQLLAAHRRALARRGESAWSDRLVAALSGTPATTVEATVTQGDIRLAATLDVPPGPGPHPLLLLTHSSGEGERSFVAYRHLAELLPAHGIAVARFDRRGSGASNGDFATADFDDLADDALAVLDWAREQPDIDGTRVGVWGLSQGGWIAPLAAARDPSIAFVVVVSGAGGTPAEQMIFASRFALREAGFDDSAIEAATALRRTIDDFYRGRITLGEAERRLTAARREPWFQLAFEPDQLPERPETSKWFHQLDFDPAPSIERIQAPVLLLIAERDPWIPTEETERAWKSRCPCEVTVVRIAGSNHFMAATTSPDGDLDAEPVAPAYSSRLVDWLTERTGVD